MPDQTLSFVKMQGTGNDFVVWDNRTMGWSIDQIAEITPHLCDRHFGIGSDGVLVLSESKIQGADYQMIFRNPDGSDAGMCGNGGRCMARFAHRLGFPKQHTFHVHQNIYEAQVIDDKSCLAFPMEPTIQRLPEFHDMPLFEIHPGTEHFVLITPDLLFEQDKRLLSLARELRYDRERAPKGANVNFTNLQSEHPINLKTYERGVEDFTLACGTGAIAAALASYTYQFSQSSSQPQHQTLNVQPEGGLLSVSFTPQTNDENEVISFSNLELCGPAEFVFEGTVQL